MRKSESSETKLDSETELPKAEQLIQEPSMEQISNQEEQSKPENDLSGIASKVSPNVSNHSSMDILYNDELDFLEVQKVNNIMRAAYKEVMEIAIKAKAWGSYPPPTGSVEDLQEIFHTPPPHGSRVECSVQSSVLHITSSLLISIMMDVERWASLFSNIICFGSNEDVITPLKKIWSSDTTEVILVNAEFRLPAEYLPKWSNRFFRFKKMVLPETWAIFDVSTHYFDDTTFDPTQCIGYKRRPSGLIIRDRGLYSEVIWVENAVVQKTNFPKSMRSNSPLTATYWMSMLSQNLKRRRSKVLTSEMYLASKELPNLVLIGDNLKRTYLQTVNPFPKERTWDLFCDDKIRILRDLKAHSGSYHNDYIASSTIYVPETPAKLLIFLNTNNVKLQWSSIKYLAQLKMAVAFVTEDESNSINLRVKIGTEDGKFPKGLEFFLQETSVDEYCSFVLSSKMSEADVEHSLKPRFCKKSLLLRPSGFAIMPAGPGGLQSRASFVTICISRKLENMNDNQAIETMRGYMNAIIDQITHIGYPIVTVEAD